ncbi:MAG: hypothetical protein P4L69_21930 [Desulfosporosinus sp.]|nr:hypothetical protein [Desulfosporosinus sp.]
MIEQSGIKIRDLRFGGYMVLILSSLLYGGTVVAARGISGDIPPVALSLFRGVFGLLVLFPLARRSLR